MFSVLSTKQLIRGLQLLSAVLIGMLLGAGLMVMQTGHTLERMMLERGQLLSQLQWHRARNEKLSEQLSERRWTAVEEVELVLEGVEPDSPEELHLQEELLPYLQQLLGRRLTKLDPEVVLTIFEGRVIEYEQRKYSLEVRTVVLALQPQLILEVSSTRIRRRDSD